MRDDSNSEQRAPAFDADAAALLFERYSQRLSRLAEQHISRRVALRESGDDIVQSVFRTFFRRAGDGEFQIDNSSQIWRLLVTITIMKSRAKGRFHTAEKRNVNLQSTQDELLEWVRDRDATAEDAAVVTEQIEVLLNGLPPLYAQLLDLRLQSCSIVEIAEQLQVSRQTVYRAIDLLQQRLMKLSTADSD